MTDGAGDKPIVIVGVVYVKSEEPIGDVLVVAGEHITFLDEVDVPAPFARKTRTTPSRRGSDGF